MLDSLKAAIEKPLSWVVINIL